jgi:hypothetical protein
LRRINAAEIQGKSPAAVETVVGGFGEKVGDDVEIA